MRRSRLLLTVMLALMAVGPVWSASLDERPQRHLRTEYVWPYTTGPSYGSVPERAGDGTPRFRTAVGDFDLTRGAGGIPEELTTVRTDARYFVIQLDASRIRDGVLAEVTSTIERSGGAVVHRVPEASLIVRLTAGALAELQKRPGDWLAIEPYHAAYKLHPTIGRTPLRDPLRAASEIYDLDIRLFPGEDATVVAKRVEELGGQVSAVYPDTVRAELHRTRLAQLAQLQAVAQIFEHLPVYAQAEETTTTIQTGRYNQGATPYHDAGVDGGGDGTVGPQVLMVLDSGIQLDAGDLSDTRVSPGVPGPAHRKVRLYETVVPFGGDGDLLGCDAGPSGGYTHGHVVAVTALGNATAVDPMQYGEGWSVTDVKGRIWKLDGVAPRAVLVAYDAQRTPTFGGCHDPSAKFFQGTAELTPGDLYSGGSTGSLGASHAAGARIGNLSWVSQQWAYDSNAIDIDQFLFDKSDAMVFVAVGNNGLDADNDYVSDEETLGSPSTLKNGLAIGASRAANDFGAGGQEEERAFFSGTGPTPGNRIAPQLMAPGDEDFYEKDSGILSEFACRTADNDSNGPVACDVITGLEGTSYSTAAASGTALLVRDYFAQGFYPDGTSANPGNDADRVPQLSGALVKSVLIASAHFLTGDKPPEFSRHFPKGDGLTVEYRFNIEQGFGRIQLDKVLPLQSWPAGVTAMRVADGGIDGGVSHLPGLDGILDTTVGETDSATLGVCSDREELRAVLSWLEPPSAALTNDLDLELVSPTGVTYHGNYFTDDDDRDGETDLGTEDCPGIDGLLGALDASAWSLPACVRGDGTTSPHDRANPTEGVFLSPDPFGDGTSGQIETGNWTVRVIGASGMESAQRYAVAIAGGLCTSSWVRFDRTSYSCNQNAAVQVLEFPQPGDLDPDATTIGSRSTLEVVDRDGVVVDEEGPSFLEPVSVLEFNSFDVPLTAGTARDPGNGALDVRHGDTIRMTYRDAGSDGMPDPERLRVATATIDCAPGITVGGVTFAQFGRDLTYGVVGGCERNARDQFEFGFPDRYLDAGETLQIGYGFVSRDSSELVEARLDLRCVIPDADSPAGCAPGTEACADPERSNNPSCDQRPSGQPGDVPYMTILGTPQTVGLIPSNARMSAFFGVEMAAVIVGTPEVEMILSIEGATSGRSRATQLVTRHRLDVDELSLFYSTDFPTGGVESYDQSQARAGDEILENPTTNAGNFQEDYRFETRTWSDLTAGGTKNLTLLSPWNFDQNDGGFRTGILASTDLESIEETIAQWGEDLNFNGILDRYCSDDMSQACQRGTDCNSGSCLSPEDRDEAGNGQLDQSWNTQGGCGWQTKDPGEETGGIWHTGSIRGTTDICLAVGDGPGQCQTYEIVGGTTGSRVWREALVTPIIQSVNGSDYEVEIIDWAWNQAIDLGDSNTAIVWEFDTDVSTIEPVDLFGDTTVLNSLFGPYGVTGRAENNPDLTNGFSMFAPLDQTGVSWNGVLGNNRVGQNACFFENGAINLAWVCPGCPTVSGDLGFAGPLDNDLDDDGDSLIDEYVTANGPVRNMDMYAVNGPDMRFNVLEDQYGKTGEFFQAAIGIWNFERTPTQAENKVTYGLGVDDMVIQWREFTLTDDANSCESGECAVVYVQSGDLYDSNPVLSITVLERTPPPFNDCDCDGVAEATDDCNSNGIPDLVVRVSAGSGGEPPPGEIVVLDRTANPIEYRGEIPVSTSFDGDGMLYVVSAGYLPQSWITVTYRDDDDGTGEQCSNDVDPAKQGRVMTVTSVLLRDGGDLRVISAELVDNGDGDAYADSNETVELRLRLSNKGMAQTGVIARITTDDPKIDCILQPTASIGDFESEEERSADGGFLIRVADVDRTAAGLSDLDDFSVTFDVTLSSDQFEGQQASLTLDLDLDMLGGACNDPQGCRYFEGWEGLSNVNCNDQAGQACTGWQAVNIDSGLTNLSAVDGYRCQYSDPDWVNSHAYWGGITDCFLGTNQAQADKFWWHINTPADLNLGKAYSGSNSLHMGEIRSFDNITTPVAVLEWLEIREPINLAAMPAPVLSYKQQVDFMDDRNVNVAQSRSPSRGIVQLQLADGAGDPVGDWIKLYPYVNAYDTTAQNQYFQCSFDPIDDGNDEDSFFDPTDPDRELGPSSTCTPEMAFVYSGETFSPFGVDHLARAEGPGFEGSVGIGTWVEPRFDLYRFRGRRVRLRFLYTDLMTGSGGPGTWEDLFQFNPSPGDDGWWIDDVEITNTLDEPATIVNDDKDNSLLPPCGNTCNVVQPSLVAEPATALPAPGHVVRLSALDSTADRCVGGILQARFWSDGNGDGQGGGAQDTVLRSWSETPELLQAPAATTTYVAEVRCSSDPTCVDSAAVEVVVTCPTSGRLSFPTVLATGVSTLDWGESIDYDYAIGKLANLAGYVTEDSGQNNGPSSSFDISTESPLPGEGYWCLFRQPGVLGGGATGFCNAGGVSWGSLERDATLP